MVTLPMRAAERKQTPLLVPPIRFATVEYGLYRGGYPYPHTYAHLQRLRLRTILSLTPTAPDDDLMQFCARNAITHAHVAVAKSKESPALSPPTMLKVLQMMLDADAMPMLVHCLDGADVVGLVMVCLRKLQRWHLSPAVSEFNRYSRDGSMGAESMEFVQKFTASTSLGAILSGKHRHYTLCDEGVETAKRKPTWMPTPLTRSTNSRPSSSSGSKQKLAMTDLTPLSPADAPLKQADAALRLAKNTAAECSLTKVDALAEPLSQTVAALALEGLE